MLIEFYRICLSTEIALLRFDRLLYSASGKLTHAHGLLAESSRLTRHAVETVLQITRKILQVLLLHSRPSKALSPRPAGGRQS
jgi:hypothetical protein